MYIHIGCGKRRLPGYISVDADPNSDADHIALASELPFNDGIADKIYACHVLEHIPRPYIMATLTEWNRVLKPGGLLRISVPDFKVACELYLNDGVPLWRVIGMVMGRGETKYNRHYVIWDHHYLAWHLTQTGFYNVRKWTPALVPPNEYDDYSFAWIDDRLISLNLEATAK